MSESKPITQSDLAQFTGDLDRYQHGMNRMVVYTPGVQFLAERANAYWLIDAIASYFGSDKMKKAMLVDERLQWLQFWRLDVQENRTATLLGRADSDVDPFVCQQIPYTDFPMDHIDIWSGFDGTYWTLYLPSEH